MEYNKKRHKVLKLLSGSRLLFDSGLMRTEPLGVSFDKLEKELNCDKIESARVYAPLFTNKEVEYTNVDFEGLFLTQKGLTSFIEKKYLKQNNNIIISWFKFFVQIIIPIFSLLIAVLALTIKIKNLNSETSKEISTIKMSQKESINKIDRLEKNTKNLQTEILILSEAKLIDSLKN